MEFIIMLGVMMVFALAMLGVMGYYSKVKFDERSSDAAINLVSFIQNEVIISTKMKPGYKKEFKLPEKVNNKDYLIETNHTDLSVIYQGKEFSTIIPNVTGSFEIGDNTIRNIDGNIFVN